MANLQMMYEKTWHALLQQNAVRLGSNLAGKFAIPVSSNEYYLPTKHLTVCVQVFVEDMMDHPNNGYALLGLTQVSYSHTLLIAYFPMCVDNACMILA